MNRAPVKQQLGLQVNFQNGLKPRLRVAQAKQERRRLMIQDPTGQWIPWVFLLNVAGLWVSEEKSQKQDDVVEYVYNVKS